MFGKRFELFKLFGIPVRIDMSWFIILFLISWSLALGYFPSIFPALSGVTYWFMGIVSALGLFVSVILHEISHSLVARHFGLPIHGITLFIFGGVAEMSEEPDSPKTELLMAIAGPIASIAIAGIFLFLNTAGMLAGLPLEFIGITGYLAVINGVLALFNLIPAFPLDGGRAFRSILWRWKGNLRWASRIASKIGAGFGMALIILGLLGIISGAVMGGIWWILIGLFLRNAARTSFEQLQLREALKGETVSRFMQSDPITVPASTPLNDVVDHYFYTTRHKLYPVVEDDTLLGHITLEQVKQVPREEWPRRQARDILDKSQLNATIHPDTHVLKALSLMNETGNSRLWVTLDDRIVGMLALGDIMRFLRIKTELEQQSA